jgi:hypothetical protein
MGVYTVLHRLQHIAEKLQGKCRTGAAGTCIVGAVVDGEWENTLTGILRNPNAREEPNR